MRQYDEAKGVACRLHQKLGARQQFQALFFGFDMRAHHAGDRAFVSNGECGVAQALRTFGQLFGVRGAALKAEVAQRVEFGVVRELVNHQV